MSGEAVVESGSREKLRASIDVRATSRKITHPRPLPSREATTYFTQQPELEPHKGWSECWKDVVVYVSSDRLTHLNDGPAIQEPTFLAERWLNSEVGLHVHFVRLQGGQRCGVCALLYKGRSANKPAIGPGGAKCSPVSTQEGDQPMFVQDVQSVKPPKGMVQVVASCRVRLQSLEYCDEGWVGPLNLSSDFNCTGFEGHAVGVAQDRELGLLFGVGRSVGVVDYQLPDEVVQEGAANVHELPNQDAVPTGQVDYIRIVKDAMSVLGIYLCLDGIRTTNGILSEVFDGVELFFSPIHFCLNPNQGMSAHAGLERL